MSLEEELLQVAKKHEEKQDVGPDAWWKKFEEDRISIRKEYKRGHPILELNGANICSLGNFSNIIGKAKSRKTWFLTLVVGMNIKDLPPEANKVIWFDTEMDKSRSADVQNRIFKLSGLTLEEFESRFYMINLRPERLPDKLGIVETSIYRMAGVGVVVIDGIRDLLKDINDYTIATEMFENLLRWSADCNCHIFNVLHQNKGDNHARGAIGTELNNKGEATITVELDESDPDTQSIIRGAMVRDKNFKPFIMKIDDDGMPSIVGEYEDPEAAKPKLPTDFDIDAHHEIALRVFDQPELATKELRESLVYVAEQFSFRISQSKLPSWIKHYEKFGLITTDDPPRSPKKTYRLTSKAKEWKPKDTVPF